MKKDRWTPERLKRELWWWRQPLALERLRERTDPHEFDPGPGSGRERLAFTYELASRAKRELKLPPYHLLPDADLMFLRGFINDDRAGAVSRYAFLEEHKREAGWSQASTLQWNLNLPDNTLARAFQQFIRKQRELQNLSKPKPHASRSSRGLAWRWPEVLDMDYHNLGPLNDGERTALHSARLKSAELAARFGGFLSEFKTKSLSGRFPSWLAVSP